MTLSGTGALTTTAGIDCTTLIATSNASISGNLNITGSLTISSFFTNKPWVGVRYTGTLVPLGSPGFCQTNVTVNTGTAGTYTFTIPAHPNGPNYMVFVQQQITTLGTAIAIDGTNVINSTSFTVYSKQQRDCFFLLPTK